MTDCPHDQGQHYIGDCGDVDAALTAAIAHAIQHHMTNTQADWLHLLGAIE
ncbi:MAG: hypothetical protein WBA38_04145 [Gordonia sp. (in: high G+C Gram-positive bacteria)]|uniref:hypothetical protein n=1 Tax=Gordonia sp. (in: high G+C Gram-positive bacteria) TaxID=84139 RepID=UPI003C724095